MSRAQITGIAIIWGVAVLLTLTSAIDIVHAALLAVCGSAAVLIRLGQPADTAALPPLPAPKHAGAHGDLSALAWGMFDIDGSVSSRPIARVRALADTRPDLQAAIDNHPHPSAGQVIKWLDAIEKAQGDSNASS